MSPVLGLSFQALWVSNDMRVKSNAGVIESSRVGLNIVHLPVLPCIITVVDLRQQLIVHGFACWNATSWRFHVLPRYYCGFVFNEVLETFQAIRHP